MGRGGFRVGAGRKKKNPIARALDANAGHRGRVLAHPSVPAGVSPPAVVDEAAVPNELTLEERQVWLRLAPHALAAKTLTEAWAYAFIVLCRNIVLERRYALSVTDAGGASHRGLIQRIDAELRQFRLAPCGETSSGRADVPTVDPLKDKYFGSRNGA